MGFFDIFDVCLMCFVCGQSRPFFIVANPTNGNRKFKQGDQKAGFTLVADQWNYNFDTFQTGSVGPSSAQPRVEFFIFFFTVLLQDGEQRNR